MAAAVVKHAGARFVVVTDVNDYRLGLAKQMGADVVVNPRQESLKDIQRQLGMREGFDVGLEMSGNPAAFRELVNSMCHGGKIAMLGDHAAPFPGDEQARQERQVFAVRGQSLFPAARVCGERGRVLGDKTQHQINRPEPSRLKCGRASCR